MSVVRLKDFDGPEILMMVAGSVLVVAIVFFRFVTSQGLRRRDCEKRASRQVLAAAAYRFHHRTARLRPHPKATPSGADPKTATSPFRHRQSP